MRAGMVGLVLLTAAAIQAAAAQDYPWCAVYDMQGSVTNCGFVSLEQCRWTVSGVGGYCAQNPYLAAAPAGRPRPGTKTKRAER